MKRIAACRCNSINSSTTQPHATHDNTNMVQLYATVNCSRYPRTCIRIASSSLADSNRRTELNLGGTTKESSLLGLYAMNGGWEQYSYAQNSSYQVGISRFQFSMYILLNIQPTV